MGNNSSTTSSTHASSEVNQLEALFEGPAPPQLAALQRTFAKLGGEKSNSIHASDLKDLLLPSPAYPTLLPDPHPVAEKLLQLLFGTAEDISWLQFLQGASRCCREQSASARLTLLLSLFGPPSSPNSNGSLTPSALFDKHFLEPLFITCWILSRESRTENSLNSTTKPPTPKDFDFLVQGALQSGSQDSVSSDSLASWISSNLPALPDCIPAFLARRLSAEDSIASPATEPDVAPPKTPIPRNPPEILPSPLTSWAIGLSQKGSRVDLPLQSWATDLNNNSSSSQPHLLYGEGRYVYSHAKVAGQSYQATPTPQGLGFGGSPGKERVWLDSDFATVLVRHHALDKTYGAGELIPNQGYGEVKSKLEDVEVWGLGGVDAKEHLTSYKRREALFAEQRAKVDLSKFGNWEDSPEKMMLNMVSNPNRPEREER